MSVLAESGYDGVAAKVPANPRAPDLFERLPLHHAFYFSGRLRLLFTPFLPGV